MVQSLLGSVSNTSPLSSRADFATRADFTEGQLLPSSAQLCQTSRSTGRPLYATGIGGHRSRATASNPRRSCGTLPYKATGGLPLRMTGSLRYKRPSEASRKYIAAAKLKASAFGATDTCRNITWQEGAVSRAEKETLLGQRGCVIWFTGLSGSGKSTVAITLEHALAAHGRLTTLLDGDNIRHGLNSNLGFSQADREENIRRIGEVSKLMMEAGVMTIASFISPYSRDRELVRARMPAGDFIEVFMNVPLEVCEGRDPKGLYKLASERPSGPRRAGKLTCFTGIDDPYEAPLAAEVVLEHVRPDGSPNAPDDMAATVVDYLRDHGFLPQPGGCRAAANGC